MTIKNVLNAPNFWTAWAMSLRSTKKKKKCIKLI